MVSAERAPILNNNWITVARRFPKMPCPVQCAGKKRARMRVKIEIHRLLYYIIRLEKYNIRNDVGRLCTSRVCVYSYNKLHILHIYILYIICVPIRIREIENIYKTDILYIIIVSKWKSSYLSIFYTSVFHIIRCAFVFIYR